MPFTRVQRRFCAWLALLAMVLGALNPALARTVAAVSGSADWVEICSTNGIVKVLLDDDSRTALGTAADHAEPSCQFCLMGGAPGLPPAAATLAPDHSPDAAPRVPSGPPLAAFAGFVPASRGPPAA